MRYLNLVGFILAIVLALWELEGLAWRRRYSNSPESPFCPMALVPYPSGFGGPARCFSAAGREKKSNAMVSICDITAAGTLWLITLKKPNSSQAFTMSLEMRPLWQERSMVGMAADLMWSPCTGLKEAATMVKGFFFLCSRIYRC